jgi:hypothetical protein
MAVTRTKLQFGRTKPKNSIFSGRPVAGNLRIGTRARTKRRTKGMAALDQSPPIICSIVQEEIGNRLQLVAV